MQTVITLLIAVILGLYVCRNFTEKYLSKNMKVIINDIKKKEREGKLWANPLHLHWPFRIFSPKSGLFLQLYHWRGSRQLRFFAQSFQVPFFSFVNNMTILVVHMMVRDLRIFVASFLWIYLWPRFDHRGASLAWRSFKPHTRVRGQGGILLPWFEPYRFWSVWNLYPQSKHRERSLSLVHKRFFWHHILRHVERWS